MIKDAARISLRFYNVNNPQHLSNKELEALEKRSKNKLPDEGHSLFLVVDRDVYVSHMENIPN